MAATFQQTAALRGDGSAAVTVTLVTRDATLDDLSVADYRDIYDELRQDKSLGAVVALLQSEYSRAMWHQYEHGERALNRTMRNELRAAMNRTLLPPTVAEATAQASPDAAVWTVGDGVPEHVIMVSATPVTLHVNGSVSTVAQTSNVTGVTRGKFQRKRYVRPCVPFEYAERLAGLVGVSWQDVFERGLQAYENA